MSAILLDPKNDFVFKKLFVDAPDLLADLINAVRSNEEPVEVVEILNPQINLEDFAGESIALDLLVRNVQGQFFNVEMRVYFQSYWTERNLYCLAPAYIGQWAREDDHAAPTPVIAINLLDFDLFEDDQAHWCFQWQDRGQFGVRLDTLQLHMLELRKLDRQRASQPGPLADWVAYFKHWREETVLREIHHSPVKKALERLKRLSQDGETRRRALAREGIVR